MVPHPGAGDACGQPISSWTSVWARIVTRPTGGLEEGVDDLHSSRVRTSLGPQGGLLTPSASASLLSQLPWKACLIPRL